MAETNCIGDLYYSFGIEKEEKYVSPVETNLGEYFKEVTNPREAQAVAFIPDSDRGLDVPPLHVARLDPENKYWVIHRPAEGEEEVREPLTSIMAEYQDTPNIKMVFLKLKEKAPELIPA